MEKRDDIAYSAGWPGGIRVAFGQRAGAVVTLQWPPAPSEEDAPALSADPGLAVPVRGGLTDPRLISGVAEITAMIAAQLDDGASAADVMPVIRDTAPRWLEQQVRAGLLPASIGGAPDDLARAVHDQRYELGPVTAYLRDPRVENVDINGFDQK